MKNYSTILLDLDDTVFDFTTSQAVALRKTVEMLGLAFETEILERFKHINHQLWSQHERGEISKQEALNLRWRHLLESNQLDAEPEILNDYFLKMLAEVVHWIDGANHFFHALTEKFRVVIVTNGHAATQRKRMARAGIAKSGVEIVISDEVGSVKPSPEIFDHALNIAGVRDKRAALMIGDNYFADISGAMRSGIDACWFNPAGKVATGDIQPILEAKTYQDIRAFLKLPKP
jgi:2-haloacid dehalogenase